MTCAEAWGLYMGTLFPGIAGIVVFILLVISLLVVEAESHKDTLFGIPRGVLATLGLALNLALGGVCVGLSAYGWEAYRDMTCDPARARVYERGVPD